uniref:Uncharacterized protein n=1 Tax=Meloidogyne enterolobii TaxID=390850 RepID=A0A6V7UXU5_MELEN|nr:unnamed protein product [Meloidogyne enterolobii]
MNIRNYYYERDPQYRERVARSNKKILTKIIKGAARALAQFHQYGGHRDIQYPNFLVSSDQDLNSNVIDVKLIDFNNSLIYKGNQPDRIEGIQREDVYKFGRMVYKLFNEHYGKRIPKLNEFPIYNHNSKLDRVIKACFQDESIRPSMQEIVDFLNRNNIGEFEYERNIRQVEQQQQHHETPQIEHSLPPDASPPPVAANFRVFAVKFDLFSKI